MDEYKKMKRDCLRDIVFLYCDKKPTVFLCRESKIDCLECSKIKQKNKKYKITLE